jgi:hypothetical protein
VRCQEADRLIPHSFNSGDPPGELKKIPKLKYWNLESVLTNKYGVEKELVSKLSECLTKMLQIDPAKRWKAWEILNDDGSWLGTDE